jgi:DNA primase
MTSGGWAKAVCPFHKDSKPSFFVNLQSGYAHCFGCGRKMGLQELLDKLNIKSVKAEDVVTKKLPPRRVANEVNDLPDYILGAYYSCPTRLVSAGFQKQLLREFEVGFDSGLFRITFPIRDMHGKLVAVSGRNLEGEPKYQVYTYEEEFPEYVPRPKDHLYNLHRVFNTLTEKDNPLYLVEGYKACLWLAQHGYNAVALMGAQMTKTQRKLITMFDVPLVLCLDNDDAGRAATVVNYLELSRSILSRVVEYPAGMKQPDDMPADLLHETLNNPQEFRRFYHELPRQHEEVARPLPRKRKAFVHKPR